MEVIEVIKIVGSGIALIYAVVATIVAVRKSKCNKEQSTYVETDFMTILNNNLVKYMTGAETFFKGITAVGTKTGSLKEEQVVDKIKLDCLQNGVVYDDEITKEKIKEIVNFKNS